MASLQSHSLRENALNSIPTQFVKPWPKSATSRLPVPVDLTFAPSTHHTRPAARFWLTIFHYRCPTWEVIRKCLTPRPRTTAKAALVLALALSAQTGFAGVWLASLDGVCLDEHGKPLSNTAVHFTDPKNGKYFDVRTDSAGKFFYIAAQPSIYTLLIKRGQRPPAIFEDVDIPWSSQPLRLEINLERNAVTVTRQTMLPEFFRQDESQAALLAQGNGDQATVGAINQQLATAKQFSNQGEWQGAIRALWNAIEIDANRDLPWALLGAAYYGAATHSANSGKTALEQCVTSYQKAIAIAPSAAYHNNLGNAYVKLEQYDDAVEQYRQAELLNPGQSSLYQQNIGMALVEEAQARPNDSALELLQQALAAFNHVPAAETTNAEVFYWRGICQLRLAANGRGSYRDVAAEFHSYLKLAPRGRFAAEVEAMLKALPGIEVGGTPQR
jgi:tetratricopeptide (TPR) repeat protein